MSAGPDVVLVRCSGLTRVFGEGPGAVTAVKDVGCQLLPGARVAVSGPSGSGKSSLLHLLAGIDRPTSGAISWPGLGGPAAWSPGRVGLVFQGPSLLPALTAVENVAFPLLLAGAQERDAAGRAGAVLGRLGLGPLSERLPEELSGGQAQRVAVARAVVSRPGLLLADEPTGQLDRAGADEVVDTLLEATRAGSALLITTHDPEVAARLDERWSMADGRLDTGLSRVELGFAAVLAMAAAGLVLALGMAERRRSFAIASALGARRRQVAAFTRSEAGVVTALGMFSGAIAAWALAVLVVKLLTGVFDPPPSHLAVPWLYLSLVAALTLAAVVAGAELTVRAAGRGRIEALRDL